MKIKFFGGTKEVGRSCILVEDNDTKVVLDCGIKLGDPNEFPTIPDHELQGVDAVIVSHAHLDHVGYLPHIFSKKWNGHAYMTKPTFELANVLVKDYIHISNPKEVTNEGLNKMQKYTKFLEFNEETQVKGLKIRLFKAGHILGSAMIHLDNGRETVLYTGDINLRSTKILDGVNTEHLQAQTLITESTYGGNEDIFPSEKKITSDMVQSIAETLKIGGKVIIPSFGVGRAQEVLLMLDDYVKSGIIPKVNIYTDGMINKAMRIHRHNVIYCKEELQKRILLSEDDPFKSVNFHDVDNVSVRKKVMRSDEASIIVTTSGMLTGGPVLRYLEGLSKYSENKLILVGYQGEGTLGRKIQDGEKEVEIKGRKVQIKMGVETYHLSAHADREQLIKLVSKVNDLQNVFIVHGEGKKTQEFHDAISGNKYKVHVPEIGQEFNV